jgi:signal transduction histidine kinase
VRVTLAMSEVVDLERLPNETWLAPEPHVRITVADDGPGMALEQLQRITAGSELDARHGLGLVTARRLIRRNGGTIRCHSDPGRGTTTELVLPRVVRRDTK